ncbi:hypothetical protein ACHQM5_027410 [Ranunculus cassubicifolius]
MTAGMILEDQQILEKKKKKQIDKQMGCMAGFFQIFDRHQLLPGRRVYSAKRLPPSPSPTSTNSPSSSEKSLSEEESPSPALSKELAQPCVESAKQPTTPSIPIPATDDISAKITPTPSESKETVKSTWKFKEYPRLSLDSRVIVDGKGSVYPREIRTNAAFISATGTNAEEEQKRSPSVVARLMGLEMLPELTREPFKKPELKRSSSESRLPNRFVDIGNALREGQKTESKSNQEVYIQSWKQQKKIFFDAQDFFPEPKSIYGELEKRLKMRGITEKAEDLQTLKQILEALQLKGLLHSKKRLQQIGNRNFIFDQENPHPKPSKSTRRIGNQSPPTSLRSKAGIRRTIKESESLPPVRRRLEKSYNEKERRFSHSMSPERSEGNARSPSSPARRKLPSVETQRRRNNDSVQQQRNSPGNSPKIITPRKTSSSSSPRNIRRSTAEICRMSDDDTSSISSCISTISHKRMKRDEYREEINLMARCDKLLNSIAEISTTESSQPSPVSVLDSSFYQEDVSPLKRCIDFKDDDEVNWSPVIKPIQVMSDDADFVYVSEIIEASTYISGDSDLFLSLEKQIYNSCDASRLHRRLVFDTIAEIIDRKKELPPWKAVSSIDHATKKPSFKQVWLEFSRIRERSKGEDLLEVICGILQKDVENETINGWGDNAMEKSEMVLDIEKMIFKDLIGDTIQDLAEMSRKRRDLAPKKLVF